MKGVDEVVEGAEEVGVVNPPKDAIIPPSPIVEVVVPEVICVCETDVVCLGLPRYTARFSVVLPPMIMLEPDGSRLKIVPLTIITDPPAINVSEPIFT